MKFREIFGSEPAATYWWFDRKYQKFPVWMMKTEKTNLFGGLSKTMVLELFLLVSGPFFGVLSMCRTNKPILFNPNQFMLNSHTHF